MDKKDEIILQQLDVIRSMTENNMKRMNSDFWGTPFENVTGSAPKSPGRRRPPRPLIRPPARPRRRSPAARSSRRRPRSLCPRRT